MNIAAKSTRRVGTTTKRDTLTIVGLLLIIAVAYLAYHLPGADSPTAQEEIPFHPDLSAGGMDNAMNALANLPKDYETLVPMGNSFMDQGSFAVAAEIYKRALAINDVPDVRIDYGACLNAMGLPLRAIEEFQQARLSDPNHAIACFNLGIVYFSQQQQDSARTYFNKYLELDPTGQAAEATRGYLQELGE